MQTIGRFTHCAGPHSLEILRLRCSRNNVSHTRHELLGGVAAAPGRCGSRGSISPPTQNLHCSFVHIYAAIYPDSDISSAFPQSCDKLPRLLFPSRRDQVSRRVQQTQTFHKELLERGCPQGSRSRLCEISAASPSTSFHAAVDLANRFIAEIEQIRVEKRQMPIGSDRPAMLWPAILPIAAALSSCSKRSRLCRARHGKFATSQPHRYRGHCVRSISLTMMPFPTTQSGGLRQICVRLDPDSGDDDIDLKAAICTGANYELYRSAAARSAPPVR